MLNKMLNPPSTARDIWAAVRRSATVINRYENGRVVRITCRPAAVPVARGRANLRDAMRKSIEFMRQSRTVSLHERLAKYVAETYTEVIAARGGETTIDEKDRSIPLSVVAREGGLTLLRAEGWRHYSNRFGAKKAAIAYLCGRDDNGRWAARVPATCASVADALEAITPAAVKAAIANGKRIVRQGDVYAVETAPRYDQSGDRLPENHIWDAETRTLIHADSNAPHAALQIPFPVRWAVQNTLRMGRTSSRGRGD